MRSALLASSNADALLSFADTPHGHDDLEIWQHALEVLPANSPRYALAAERVAHAAFGGYKSSGIGRENHSMMLDHYQ